jgi:branched-chain amino acid transport system permease protein
MTAHDVGYWLQQLINVLTLASFYIPLAAAYALVQGITNKIFLSFGDFAMYAAFASVYAAMSGQLAGYDMALVLAGALVMAALSAGALGRFTGATVFASLVDKPSHAFMIAGVGLSITLQELMRLQSGNRDVWLQPPFEGAAFPIYHGSFDVQLGYTHAYAIAASVIAVALVLLAMRFTAFGRNWRACSQSQKLAMLCGVDARAVLLTSCMLSAALASVSGWIIAVVYGGVSFSLGLMLGFKAMFASVIGGFGTLHGAILGGLFLAAAETLWSALFPMAYRDAAVFGLIIFILTLKPGGLASSFSRRESEA